MYLQNLKAIFLVAGHGERKSNGVIDQGAVANGTTERKEVVEITRETVQFMKAQPFLQNVKIFEIGVENNVSLRDKIKQVNLICNEKGYNSKNSILVSVHVNAGGGNGVEAWHYGNDKDSFALGEAISKEMAEFTGLRYRGTFSEFYNRWGQLGIIHNTKPLATLVECGFIDNIKEANLLKDQEKDDGFAKGITKGVLDFVEGNYEEVVHEIPKATTAIFKDVPQGAWFAKAAYKSQKKGILKGYADGTFRPGKTVTRAELVVVLERLGLLD